MEVRDGRLWAGATPVDVVYRRGVLSELLERADEVRDFLRAYRERLAVFVNSFRCRLSEDKAFFALLTDEAFAHLMGADERDAGRPHACPGRASWRSGARCAAGGEVDLVPHVVAQREELVLKPAHGYGGRSVYVGSETPAGVWEDAVSAGLGEPWVVQERVTIPEEEFPLRRERLARASRASRSTPTRSTSRAPRWAPSRAPPRIRSSTSARAAAACPPSCSRTEIGTLRTRRRPSS